MTRRRSRNRDMTVEEFDDWCNASKKFEEVAEAADEVGGPRLSLVPLPEQNIAWPTDLLPPNPPPACLGRGTARSAVEGLTDRPSPQPRSTAFPSNPPASGSPAGARSARGCS